MFQIADSVKDYWNQRGYRKAVASDISLIESRTGSALPASYVDFVTQFGFVTFSSVPGMRRLFDYSVSFPDRQEIREGNIAFLIEPARVIKIYDTCIEPRFDGDDEFPVFPADFLPLGNDAGQGKILLELGRDAGRIWYWPEREWAWGTEDNTWLGFVADDFATFINKLRFDPA